MITMKCPQCGKELHIEDKYAGQGGRCKKCGASMRVPSAFDEPSGSVERTAAPTPEAKALARAQKMLSIQTIGLSMTGCGCFLLFGLPILIVLVVFLIALV